jgi:hypothetical protein
MKKNDLSNLTFLIPFKFDSPERLDNINIVIKYINSNFKTNIIVYEEYVNRKFCGDIDNIHYMSAKEDVDYFHRTKIINKMFDCVDTELISIYDADVLLPTFTYIKTYNWMSIGLIDVIYPYDMFVDISRSRIKHIIDKNLENVNVDDLKIRGTNFYNTFFGGAIFVNSSFYNTCKFDERFKSWGGEDDDFYMRSVIKNANITRISGKLFHLNHFRGKDSKNSHSYYSDNCNLLTETRKKYILYKGN